MTEINRKHVKVKKDAWIVENEPHLDERERHEDVKKGDRINLLRPRIINS